MKPKDIFSNIISTYIKNKHNWQSKTFGNDIPNYKLYYRK